MLITQSDIAGVLREAREFYKGGPKSLNKYYLRPTLPKHFERNARVMSDEARDRAQATRDEITEYVYTEAGRHLYTSQIKEGNCVEMCFVVFYLCKKNPALASKIKNVYFVEAQRASHAFVLLVDRDSPARVQDYGTIFELVTKRPDGVWVIDCWMNIACHCRGYMGEIMAKQGEWHEQSKVVVTAVRSTGIEYKDHLQWSSAVIGSPLHYSRDPLFAL